MELGDCPPPLLDRDEDEEEDGELVEEEEEVDEEEEGEWEDWLGNDAQDEYLCLFCPARLSSTQLLFHHCSSQHAFDFPQLRKDLALGFYDCLRLINFIRSQVACNTCWICGLSLESQDALLQHVKFMNHGEIAFCKESSTSSDREHVLYNKHLWQDDKYLTPFLENDSLLYSFDENSDDDTTEEKLSPEEVETWLGDNEVKNLLLTGSTGMQVEDLLISANDGVKALTLDNLQASETFVSRGKEMPESIDGIGHSQKEEIKIGSATLPETDVTADNGQALRKKKPSNHLKVSFAEVAARERYSINQSYFGSYSTFGIHREMLSDKIRTDAYENAITRNPLLLEGAVVLDVGCGTGILSLFSAKAGAKKVIAVDGSKRMSLVAQQVAKANGFLNEHTEESKDCKVGGVINVVQGMIEELDLGGLVECNGVDVLVSEWMGYCLLFESMLNSVLFARNRWLKPGGAILPDVAEMFVAGFGVGGTSMSFWENVYGFDMKCIGREVLDDAASSLIVDVVESKDIVTDSYLLQAFDLVTMTESDVDFTASFELKPQVVFFTRVCSLYSQLCWQCCAEE
eukprot:c24375_g1_i1 orf=642-2360(-)